MMKFEDLKPGLEVETLSDESRLFGGTGTERWEPGVVRSVTVSTDAEGERRYVAVKMRDRHKTRFVHDRPEALTRVRLPVPQLTPSDILAEIAAAIGGWSPGQKIELDAVLSSIKSHKEYIKKLQDALNGPEGVRQQLADAQRDLQRARSDERQKVFREVAVALGMGECSDPEWPCPSDVLRVAQTRGDDIKCARSERDVASTAASQARAQAERWRKDAEALAAVRSLLK